MSRMCFPSVERATAKCGRWYGRLDTSSAYAGACELCMIELIPHLFIGNWHEARAAQGFHVITVAADSEFIGHQHFRLVDGPGNLASVFHGAVQAVCNAHRSGGNVLVHCVGGRSRSAAVAVAAAVRLTGRPLCEVYEELLRKHDGPGTGARIHPHLAVVLLEYSE